MDAAYFTAAIPEPYIIFGLRLLPLSLGRYRLLKRFGCAFVSETETEATVEDLMLGLTVCSMTTRDFIELIEDKKAFLKEMKRFGKRIRKEVKRDRFFNIHAKAGLFKAYIKDNSKCPNFWVERESDGVSATHWSVNVEMVLRELNYTSHDIEEAPLSKMLLDYFKHLENEGAIRLMADDECEHADDNAKAFEALLKGTPCPDSN